MTRAASMPEPGRGVLFPDFFPGSGGPGPTGRGAAPLDPHNPRHSIARRVSDALWRRYGSYLQAVGLHGALAHGDDTDISDVEIIVVTRRVNIGPAPVTRRGSSRRRTGLPTPACAECVRDARNDMRATISRMKLVLALLLATQESFLHAVLRALGN